MARCTAALALVLWLFASSAQANGRMPGANDIVFNEGDPEHLLARATFGLLQSFNDGASWSWICEQAIDVSGVIADPPLGMMQDGSLVLLPPTGSALLSRDRGCTWERVAEPLGGTRGVDLTLDPSDARRLLVITSTLVSVSPAGYGTYQNLVVETRDNAQSFQLLSTLPSDFEAETIEVAAGNAQRLYVSGTDATNPRLGVMLRSDDGGQTWTKTTLALPPGTGSMFISAIHPTDPDRIWVRVPARGDTIGILPARLYLSTDRGATFQLLAATTKAMFGLALSPDGSELVFGGPSDGLFIGPSDGSAEFEKLSNLGVRCLRWRADGALYVCASEPADAFSVGVSNDRGRTFRALYSLRDTCPAECAAGSSFADSCEAEWGMTRPFIRAPATMCSVPWAAPSDGEDAGVQGDAGMAEAGAPVGPDVTDGGVLGDAGAGAGDAAMFAPDAGESDAGESDGDESDAGCACSAASGGRGAESFLGLSVVLAVLTVRRRRLGRVHPRGGLS